MAEDGKGVAKRPPAYEENTKRQEGTKKADAPPAHTEPHFVRIVEDPDETKRAREREADADKHEADDLIAQQRAATAAERSATSAERQEDPARWQMVFSGIGTFLVFAALILSTIATFAAVKAVQVTRDIGQRQLRAYLSLIKIEVEAPDILTDVKKTAFAGQADKERNFVWLNIQNSGETPAHDVHAFLCYLVTPFSHRPSQDHVFIVDERELRPDGRKVTIAKQTIAPDMAFKRQMTISNIETFREAHAKEISLYFYGRIKYKDIYGRDRWTNFCHLYEPWRSADQKFTPHDRHNDAS